MFADADPADVYPLVLKLLQIDECEYEKLPQTGFSADYVRRETERAVSGVAGECEIYPGIDIDIPVRTPDNRDGLTQCSPEQVKAAVLAAFAGGAGGVVLSRKYSEMRLDNLAGA